jgi:zinc protease
VRRRPRYPAAVKPTHAVFLLLSFVLCACGAASPGGGTPVRALVMRDVSFPLRDLRFPSGLRVIVEEDHRAPLVSVVMLVGAGSTSDPPGKEGLAHYVEHLAFRARPDGKTTVWSLIEGAGAGAWNASTSFDETLYWEVGPREALGPLVALEGVRLSAPLAGITPEVAAVERDVVRSELRERNETGIFGSILGYMQAAVFPPGHPYARPVIGTHETLSAATLEDAQRFAAEHYRPENVTMVIVGDVDLQTAGGVIEQSLPPELRAGVPGRAAVPRLDAVAPAPPEPPRAPMARYQAGVPTPELWIGWSLPRGFDAEGYLDRFAAVAAQDALEGAFWHDQDIAGVHVHLVRGKQAAMLLCRVALREATDPERSVEHVVDRLVRIWSWSTTARGKIVRSLDGRRQMVPISQAEAVRHHDAGFVRLQRRAVTAMMLGAENLVERGGERAELTHFSGDPAAYSRQLQAVMGAGAERVSDFAYRYLSRERARAVLVTPLPGDAVPDLEAEPARPAPLDDVPPSFDAGAIRRFIHAPGAGAYRRVVLDNGLEVLIGRRAGLPVATVGLSLHGGTSMAEPPAAADLAWLAGRPRVPGDVVPADFGLHLGSFRNRDDMLYLFEGSAGNVASMLELLAARVPATRVDPEAMAVLDREFVPFLAKAELAPEGRALRAFRRALYGEHPYGRSLVASDLGRLVAGDANGWMERAAVPQNAVLAIVGEIDPAEVEERARDIFARWGNPGPAQAPPPPPALAPAPPAGGAPRPTVLVTHRPGATQGQIELGCLLPAVGSVARYDMMAELLQDRVTDVVRRQLGASYGFRARAVTYRGGAAHLALAGNAAGDRVAEALGAVRRAIILMDQGHWKPGEIEAARWRVARSYGVRYMTNASVVRALLTARNQDRDPGSLDAYPEDLLAVTPEALQADFTRCAAAPVLSLVGDEPTLRAAVAEVWP